MRALFRIIASVAVALTLTSCAKDQIKVISYNIRVNSSSDGDNRWDLRKQASINMISEEQPTIFGLQEAQPVHMEYLTEQLPQYGWVGVGREDGVSSGEHMTIFYLKERVELLDSGTFWLSETPDTPSYGWDAMCKRTCTWARMKMRDSGREFVYLNTHLDHAGEEARRQSMILISERIKALAPNGEPVILTADFNSTVDQPIYEPLKAIMSDTRATAETTDTRATLNCWQPGLEDKTEWVIDHIFVRNATASSFAVLRDKNYGAPFISDHYPVAAVVEF